MFHCAVCKKNKDQEERVVISVGMIHPAEIVPRREAVTIMCVPCFLARRWIGWDKVFTLEERSK